MLAAELRVNFNTVARAYRMLDEMRLISTQQGRGTYLLELLPEHLESKIKEATLEAKIKKALVPLIYDGYSQDEILEELQKIVNHPANEDGMEENFRNEEK
jgi:GntR family transcriptional regulator